MARHRAVTLQQAPSERRRCSSAPILQANETLPALVAVVPRSTTSCLVDLARRILRMWPVMALDGAVNFHIAAALDEHVAEGWQARRRRGQISDPPSQNKDTGRQRMRESVLLRGPDRPRLPPWAAEQCESHLVLRQIASLSRGQQSRATTERSRLKPITITEETEKIAAVTKLADQGGRTLSRDAHGRSYSTAVVLLRQASTRCTNSHRAAVPP